MKKLFGLMALLLVVAVVTTLLSYDQGTDRYTFLSSYNLENLLRRIGLFGVLSIAAAFVIVTGGIDLSVAMIAFVISLFMVRGLGLDLIPSFSQGEFSFMVELPEGGEIVV